VTRHRFPLIDIKHHLSQRMLYRPTYLGSVLFNGCLMQANSNYGCFMTFNMASVAEAKIPENLKVCISSVHSLYGLVWMHGVVTENARITNVEISRK